MSISRLISVFVATLLTASAEVALRDGESLSYRVSWGIFGKAGEIDIRADRLDPEKPGDSRPLRITTTTSTRGIIRAFYPFDGEAELHFAPGSDDLVLAAARTETAKKKTHASMALDYREGKARYTDYLREERNVVLALPPGRPLDLITSLIQTRTWDLAVGESRPALVLFDDEFYALIITAEAQEEIDTPLGRRVAMRLVPRMEGESRGLFKRGGSVRVWVSHDAERLPLRFEVAMKVGTGTAHLSGYTPPAAVTSAPASVSIETATVLPSTPRPRNQSRFADSR